MEIFYREGQVPMMVPNYLRTLESIGISRFHVIASTFGIRLPHGTLRYTYGAQIFLLALGYFTNRGVRVGRETMFP